MGARKRNTRGWRAQDSVWCLLHNALFALALRTRRQHGPRRHQIVDTTPCQPQARVVHRHPGHGSTSEFVHVTRGRVGAWRVRADRRVSMSVDLRHLRGLGAPAPARTSARHHPTLVPQPRVCKAAAHYVPAAACPAAACPCVQFHKSCMGDDDDATEGYDNINAGGRCAAAAHACAYPVPASEWRAELAASQCALVPA